MGGLQDDIRHEVELDRMRRKIAKRDRQIEGLRRRLAAAHDALALHEIRAVRLPIDVERAVQRALGNVRMVPVLGVGGSDRIVEIRSEAKKT